MLKSKITFWTVLAILSLSAISCNDELQSPAIFVSPTAFNFTASPGQYVEFSVRAEAGDSDLRNLTIQLKPEGGLTQTILDTALAGDEAEFFYPYLIANSQEANLNFTFKVYDQEGDNGGAIRKVSISGSSPLVESTGHRLYSKFATEENSAFNIENTQPLVLATNPDSSSVDLVNFDTTNDDVLTRSITSYSGVKFARNNDFNYAEATQQSAEGTYTSSTPVNLVSNLQIDDILITEFDTINNLYAVLQITNILDLEGTVDDRIEFKMKK
ncbi:hypothetical protein [Halocola ammonii]